jgi:hypothetical protein
LLTDLFKQRKVARVAEHSSLYVMWSRLNCVRCKGKVFRVCMHKVPLDSACTVENVEVLYCHTLNEMWMFLMNARTVP